MKSLIIIEVEHGDSTDPVTHILEDLEDNAEFVYPGIKVIDHTVMIDLPATFLLESDMPDRAAVFKKCGANPRAIRVPITTWDPTGTKKVTRY